MSLTVLDAGLYSLLVDRGRPGSRALGVPLGGAADRAAFALGNALLGNDPDAVALEVTLTGPTLRADRPTGCVVFGAPFTLAVSGRGPVPAGTTFRLDTGDVLRVGGTPDGVRGYVCVGDGFRTPKILGSHSALEPIRTGDVLDCHESHDAGRSLGFVTSSRMAWIRDDPHEAQPSDKATNRAFPDGRGPVPEQHDAGSLLTPHVTIRVLDGPQRDWFPDGAFCNPTYTVLAASNRMGLRLAGDPLTKRSGEMASEPVAPGAVQITNDGLPIVLGVDGQTIGGYPKVAHVIRADLDRLAQLRPGSTVRFERVTRNMADAAARQREAWLQEWRIRLYATR